MPQDDAGEGCLLSNADSEFSSPVSRFSIIPPPRNMWRAKKSSLMRGRRLIGFESKQVCSCGPFIRRQLTTNKTSSLSAARPEKFDALKSGRCSCLSVDV